MRKLARPSSLADKFHKGFVWTCLGLTACGFFIGANRFYHYLNVTRPNRLAIKEKLLQEERPPNSVIDPEELKS